MNTHQRPGFGSERAVEDWKRECNALVGVMTSDYAVAPQCAIRRADGSVLGPGDPVTVDDFDPLTTADGTIAPWLQLERAVRDGAVLVRGRRYPVQNV